MVQTEAYPSSLSSDASVQDASSDLTESQKIRRTVFDHRKEITSEELVSMRQKFYFRGFERIIQEVVTQIKAISPNLL